MNVRKYVICLLTALFCAALPAFAQVPPAEQLLPDDTIGLITVPDWSKLNSFQAESAWGKLWADPAMKPFRENFTSNFAKDVIEPLQKELGLKLSDYKELLQGQITFAVTPPTEGTKHTVGLLLLIDTKDKADFLSTRLTELKKKWTDSGKEIKNEKIRDVDFSTVTISGKDIDALMQKIFPAAEEDKDADDDDKAPKGEKKETQKIDLHIGQSKSLLVIGENSKVIEKILAKQSGGLVTPLADQNNFAKSQRLLFRDSMAFAWLNFKPIYQKILEAAAQQPQEKPPAGISLPQTDKILPAIGLDGLETVSAKISGNNDGGMFELLVGVPEAQREGIFKILTLEKKDASPPPFVPANVVKFQRWRIDAQKGWTTLESTLGKIQPSMVGMIQLMLSAAGKDKDPNFDLKKNLIGNLGDDFITYEKSPKVDKAENVQSPPSLVLIGSPNPGELLDALRTLLSLMPPPLSSAPVKEREFLGKKIYSISGSAGAEPAETADNKTAPEGQSFNFTASGGYVAFSADASILEEYLRSSETTGKNLRETPGLADAAQKIGGMENGLFTFENQTESLRVAFEILKKDPEGYRRQLFFGVAQGGQPGEENRMSRWFNVKLLPSYDAIAKYIGIALISGSTTPDGLYFRAFGPTPDGLKK